MNFNKPDEFIPDVDEMTDSASEVIKKVGEIPEQKIDEMKKAADTVINKGAQAAMGAMDRMGAASEKMGGMLDSFLMEESRETKLEASKDELDKETEPGVVTESYSSDYNEGPANGGDWKTEAYNQGLTDDQIAAIEANTTEEERVAYENASEEEKKQMLENKATEMGYAPAPADNSTVEGQGAGTSEIEARPVAQEPERREDEKLTAGADQTGGTEAQAVENSEGRQTGGMGAGAAQNSGGRR